MTRPLPLPLAIRGRSAVLNRWLRLLAVACLAVFAAGEAQAQNEQSLPGSGLFGGERNPQAQMLLEADEVIYNDSDNTVAAVGNVQIAYDGYTLAAQRVTYSQATGRVIATGNVEIVEPTGTRIFAEEIDITDNFSDGFISSLQVETADNTRFAAQSAERRDANLSIFNNGVYTACEPCKDDPSKPPLWQIRANKVTLDKAKGRVFYEGASFELFGRPIAYAPSFSHADPSIRRKTGFLFPSFSYSETLGTGIGESFFWAMAPNYDLTLRETYYSNQGFLSQAEWRHRTINGQYSVAIHHIDQKNRDDFKAAYVDSHVTDRTAVTTAGRFEINPFWTFGWNALWQSDLNFARTYGIAKFSRRDITNEIYLTGLRGKNFFDLRAQKFLIQDSRFDSQPNQPGAQQLQDQQATLLPEFDYNRVSDRPVYGGQVSLNANVQNVYRHEAQIVNDNGLPSLAKNERFSGIAGNWTRASLEQEWKRSEIYNGAMLTASLYGRGDAIMLNTDSLGTRYNPLLSNDGVWRGMAAGMLEIRYPLIAQDGYATHIFEPIAQIIARPNETHIGEFPNEDAQSMVFDTTNLFRRDKFSGYDRVEGGTRANYGFRYAADYDNGARLNIVAGQSLHLAGKNSFAQRDLVNAGLESGLDTDRSDYVVSANVDTGQGLALGLGGRFDEKNLAFRRGDVASSYSNSLITVGANYAYIDAQPLYAYTTRRHEASLGASIRLSEYWQAFGSFSYDLEYSNMYKRKIGLAYTDSCFTFSVAYAESEDRYTGSASGATVLFNVGLRTLGDYDYQVSLDDYDTE